MLQDETSDIWSDDNLVPWKEIDDVEIPSNDGTPWILVDDNIDTLSQEQDENNERLVRSRRQEEGNEEYEGSGDDTQIFASSSNTTEEQTNVESRASPAAASVDLPTENPLSDSITPPSESNADSVSGQEQFTAIPEESSSLSDNLQEASVQRSAPSETNIQQTSSEHPPFLGVSKESDATTKTWSPFSNGDDAKEGELNGTVDEDKKNEGRAAIGGESTG